MDKNTEPKPVALILAGCDRVDKETRRKRRKEIIQTYDGDEIYMGRNKFLYDIAGKPIIQYVLDAVSGASKDGIKIYDKIYVYNDVKSFSRMIDVSKYPDLTVVQMTDSVGGHWKHFYNNYIDYGQQVDVFFGDTPRITPEDVAFIHDEYTAILGKKIDHRGNPINFIFAVVDFDDLHDNWLTHRLRYIKRGRNRGKLKSFVGMEHGQSRVGNNGAIIKHHSIDGLINQKSVNLVYNLRKALTPSNFSKIMYYLWKGKHGGVIQQIKNRNLKEVDLINVLINIISNVFKIDLTHFGGMLYHIKKNASRWENDIDGPKDLEAFREHMGGPSQRELTKK